MNSEKEIKEKEEEQQEEEDSSSSNNEIQEEEDKTTEIDKTQKTNEPKKKKITLNTTIKKFMGSENISNTIFLNFFFTWLKTKPSASKYSCTGNKFAIDKRKNKV